jgi:hypothetical protein
MTFTFKDAPHSSELPTIIIPEMNVVVAGKRPVRQPPTEISRQVFWNTVIQSACAMVPDASGTPVYIATGGGYGSFETLIEWEKEAGHIDRIIPSIGGNMFRSLPAILIEMDQVRGEIAKQLNLQNDPVEVERILSAFYSDEVNTCIAKEVVLSLFKQGKSCIHESASLYPDTITRARAAHEQGMKTVLVAGDRDIESALRARNATVEPANTVRSYQVFAERFERELVPLFHEIRLYNTDDPAAPKLIAQKRSADQELIIVDRSLYERFLANGQLDPDSYKSRMAEAANVIHKDWNERMGETPGPARQDPPSPPFKPGEPSC